MSRIFTRWFSALLLVFGGQATADIPMVTTPMVLPSVLIVPEMPVHGVQTFEGVTKVALRPNEDNPQEIDLKSQNDLSAFGTACDLDVQAMPRAGAMIELAVYAPCHPHAAIHISHGGFAYTAQVSLTGRAAAVFPAIYRDAEVFVAVDDEIFERKVIVDDVENFARVALSGTDPELVATSLSSEMEIYETRGVQMFSVDLREIHDPMTYRLTLRHKITETSCDKPVLAKLRRILPGFSEQSQVLQLAAQDCGRIGEILELKNVLQDLKLAAN